MLIVCQACLVPPIYDFIDCLFYGVIPCVFASLEDSRIFMQAEDGLTDSQTNESINLFAFKCGKPLTPASSPTCTGGNQRGLLN